MSHRRVRIALAALAAVLVLGLGHLAAWAWIAAQVDAGVGNWLAGLRARGWQVTAPPAGRAGWPLAAGMEYGPVRVEAGPDGPAWTVERMAVTVPLLHPRTVEIRPQGGQTLRPGPAAAAIPVSASALVAQVPLDDPTILDVSADGITAGAPLNAAAMNVRVHAGPLFARMEAGPVRLPGGLGGALGDGVERMELEAALTAPLPPGAELGRRLAAWRDARGTLLLRRLAVRWGPLDGEGSATLTLDGRLRPSGTGTVRVRGAAETLDRLVGAGAVPARTVVAAKAVLALLARPAPDGKGMEVQAPLFLSDGVLQLGQIPLLRLPDGPWTAP